MAIGYPIKKPEKLNNLFVGNQKLYNFENEQSSETTEEQMSNEPPNDSVYLKMLERRLERAERQNDMLLIGLIGLSLVMSFSLIRSRREY